MTSRNLFTESVQKNYILQTEDFNEALDLALRMKHWRLSDLAKTMGYSLKNVSCVIHNKNDMTLKFARKLGAATDIDCLFWIELYLNKYKDY